MPPTEEEVAQERLRMRDELRESVLKQEREKMRDELIREIVQPMREKVEQALVALTPKVDAQAQLPTAMIPTPKEIIEYLAPGMDEKTAMFFYKACQSYNLDPWRREIHPVPFWTNVAKKGDKQPKWERRWSFIINYLIFIGRARRDRDYLMFTDGEIRDDKKNLTGAWCRIFKKSWMNIKTQSGEPFCFYHEVRFDEYHQENAQWKKRPSTMIKKVAVCQAHRLLYPQELGTMEGVSVGITDDAGKTGTIIALEEDEREEQQRESHEMRKIDDEFSGPKRDDVSVPPDRRTPPATVPETAPEEKATASSESAALNFQVSTLEKMLKKKALQEALKQYAFLSSGVVDKVTHALIEREKLTVNKAAILVGELDAFIGRIGKVQERLINVATEEQIDELSTLVAHGIWLHNDANLDIANPIGARLGAHKAILAQLKNPTAHPDLDSLFSESDGLIDQDAVSQMIETLKIEMKRIKAVKDQQQTDQADLPF